MHIRWGIVLTVAIAVGLSGCRSYYGGHRMRAEREIEKILSRQRHEAVDKHQENVRYPDPAPEEPELEIVPELGEGPGAEQDGEAEPGAAAGNEVNGELDIDPPLVRGDPEDAEVHTLSLRDAMRTATLNNRNFMSQIETVQIAALDAIRQRRNFGPIISNTLSYVYSDSRVFSDSDRTTTRGDLTGSLGVRQIVPSGGQIEATTSGSIRDDWITTDTTYRQDIDVSFRQPLLRGLGYDIAYEDLTQAERNVVYALRDFELFRQDFTIDVLRRYYRILQQKQVVENSERTYDQFRFLRERSEALFDVGRVSALDMFRAAQQELTAHNRLIGEQETLASLLDEFKVFLGLPVAVAIDVEMIEPEMRPVEIDLPSAVSAALHNRLDLKTTDERRQDAERRVRVARNNLLPDLDLEARAGADATKNSGEPTTYRRQHSLGVTLSLPLDKIPERTRYKESLITLRRRERGYEERRDEIRVEVMNTYRRLQRLANSIRIQQTNVDLAERRVRNAHLRFEAGEIGTRDVVEAESDQLDARNELIRAILDYEVARLQLKRDIGILFIDSDGMWREIEQ